MFPGTLWERPQDCTAQFPLGLRGQWLDPALAAASADLVERKLLTFSSRQPKKPSWWKELPALLFHLAMHPLHSHAVLSNRSFSGTQHGQSSKYGPGKLPLSPVQCESLTQGLWLTATLLSSRLCCSPALGTFMQNPSNFSSAVENLFFCARKRRKASQEIRCKVFYSQYLLCQSWDCNEEI